MTNKVSGQKSMKLSTNKKDIEDIESMPSHIAKNVRANVRDYVLGVSRMTYEEQLRIVSQDIEKVIEELHHHTLKIVGSESDFSAIIVSSKAQLDSYTNKKSVNQISRITSHRDYATLLRNTVLAIPKNPEDILRFVIMGAEGSTRAIRTVEGAISIYALACEMMDKHKIKIYVMNTKNQPLYLASEEYLAQALSEAMTLTKNSRVNQAKARELGYSELLQIALRSDRLTIEEAVEQVYNYQDFNKNKMFEISDIEGTALTILTRLLNIYNMKDLDGKPTLEQLDKLTSELKKWFNNKQHKRKTKVDKLKEDYQKLTTKEREEFKREL